jgi:hypothetical protein
MFQNTLNKKSAKIPKIICGIIIAIFIVAVGYFLLSAFWFWTSLEIIGGAAVAIGCIGELYLFVNPVDENDEFKKSHHRRRELQCITAVAMGVTIEFIALFHAISEGVRLEKQVEVLRKQNYELKNEQLKKGERFALALDVFSNALKGKPKSPVEVLWSDDEGWTFGKKITNGLMQAGWSLVNLRPINADDATQLGLTNSTPINNVPDGTFGPIVFVTKEPNAFPKSKDLSLLYQTNTIVGAVENAFREAAAMSHAEPVNFRTKSDLEMSSNKLKIVILKGYSKGFEKTN